MARAMATFKPRTAGRWLGLAAALMFAEMALISELHAPPVSLCPAGLGLAIDGMTTMYLLMGLFHLPPW